MNFNLWNCPFFHKATMQDERFLKSLFRRDKLVVHIVGVRGDTEMECMWSAILDRMPKLKFLWVSTVKQFIADGC